MKFQMPSFFVESITFGDRVTKYVKFDEIPQNVVDSGIESIQKYLLENYILKEKRPHGLHRNEKFLIGIK